MQALWMVLAGLLFASMGMCVKIASADFNTAELVCYRGLVSAALLWLLARRQGVALATRLPAMHAWRSLVGVASLGAWFYATTQLPLPTAMTLNYTSSLWIAALLTTAGLLGWKGPRQAPPPTLLATLLLGFGGVALLLRPSVGSGQGLAAAIGLASGLSAALAYLQVGALARAGEPETRTVFYFALGAAIAGGAAMALTGLSPWPGWHALWLLPLGLFAAGGQWCMTRAYTCARSARATLVAANLQYSGIVFASLYGVLLLGEHIAALGWLGMALIVASGIAATALRTRTAAAA